MSTYDLCSAVFVFRTPRGLPSDQFLGRAAYKLFLEMLHQLSRLTTDSQYSILADELHNMNTVLPFTVSDLFHSSGDYYWFRVTGLDARLCDVLQLMVDLFTGQTINVPPRENVNEQPWLVRVETALLSYHDWAGQTTADELIHTHWNKQPATVLTLDFMTPTFLKSVGVYRPFPEPALVFKLLYERLLKLKRGLPFHPETAHLEGFAEYLVSVTDYQVHGAQLEVLKKRALAFYGVVTYSILRQNSDFQKRADTRLKRDRDTAFMALCEDVTAHQDQYSRLVNVLAAFAFYSGVGSQTGQGMGMVRQEHLHGQ